MGGAHTVQKRNACKVLVGRSEELGSLEKSMHSWQGLYWIHLAQDRVRVVGSCEHLQGMHPVVCLYCMYIYIYTHIHKQILYIYIYNICFCIPVKHNT
jgi:hypothetical protein